MRTKTAITLTAFCLLLLPVMGHTQSLQDLNAQLAQLKQAGYAADSAEVRAVGDAIREATANLGPVPANDLCANPVVIDCNSLTAGATTGANDENDPDCSSGLAGASIWYQIVGNGGGITASFCQAGGTADYDTVLDVYDGGCGALNCIVGNDDTCGLQSEVAWVSGNGTTYDIRVSGFSAGQGNHDLAIICDIPVELTGFDVE